MPQEPEVGKIYRHFKGHRYKVICIAKDSETMEETVVYQGLYDDNPFWTRALKSFVEIVDVDGKQIPRFEKYNTPNKNQPLKMADFL